MGSARRVSAIEKNTESTRLGSLASRYEKSLEASGLVDDVSDIIALDPPPALSVLGTRFCLPPWRHGRITLGYREWLSISTGGQSNALHASEK